MIPCQFHLLGQCTKGKQCRFSHDSSVCRPGGAGKLCRDFATSGVCKNGERCVFVHQAGAQPEQAYFYGQAPLAGDSEELVGFYGEAPVASAASERRNKSGPQGTTWAKVARLPDQLQSLSLNDNQLDGGKKGEPQQVQPPLKSTLPNAEKPQSSIPCKFFSSPGGCRLGDACRFSHDRKVDMPRTTELTCGICFDDLRFKKIGILTHCDHLFCLNCIRGWRSSEMSESERTKELVQTCPVCRVRSFFVVPGNAPPTSPEEKKRLIEVYRENCSKIPCRYKDGDCPFGLSCLYHHEIVDPATLGLRFAKTVDGGDRALTSKVATLGDFILK